MHFWQKHDCCPSKPCGGGEEIVSVVEDIMPECVYYFA